MATHKYPADKKEGPKSVDQIDGGKAHILYMENGEAIFQEPNFLLADLRRFQVITEFGALTAEYGRTLFPQPEPYIMELPGRPYNIDFRTAGGVYFIGPESGSMIVYSEHAGPLHTYINKIFFLNVRFKSDGREITVNGTGEATFVFN